MGIRCAAVLVLLSSVAAADPAAFRTIVSVSGDAKAKTLEGSVALALRGEHGLTVDACWNKAARAKARLVIESGAVTTVTLSTNDDGTARACLVDKLQRLALADVVDKTELAIVLVSHRPTKNELVLEQAMNTSLSKLTAIKSPPSGALGGAGWGKAREGGLRGVDSVDRDFVSKGQPDVAHRAPVPGSTTVKVTFGKPTVSGALSIEQVQHVVMARAGIYRACYQRELNRTPSLSGRFVIGFEVAQAGTVSTTKVTPSSIQSDGLAACLVSNVSRLRFPTASGSTTVTYAFVFAYER